VVENSATGDKATPSPAFDVTLQQIQLTSITDDIGAVQGNVLNSSGTTTTDDSSLTYSGSLAQALEAGQVIHVYNHSTYLGLATVSDSGREWTFQATEARVDTQKLRFQIEDAAKPGVGLLSTTASVETAASETLSDQVSSNTLKFGSNNQTIDLTKIDGSSGQPRFSAINMDNAGSDIVILDIDDVLASAAGVFTDTQGYEGLGSDGRKQIGIEGDVGDKIEVKGSGWEAAGSVTVSDTTYAVFNYGDSAQLLIDLDLERLGAVL